MDANAAKFVIGVDLMGADIAPHHILNAILALPADVFSDLHVVFFGSEILTLPPHMSVELCPDVVSMDENPLKAIREKRASSLMCGIRALKDKKISAFISCANTGALLAGVRTELKCLPGIQRPALACLVPTLENDVLLLDCGANVEASPQHLVQFAELGTAFMRTYQGIKRPKIALLNIGEEEQKGTHELKSALTLLQEAENDTFEFVGNKEPYDIFARKADVFVTNGFSGNLFLKTSEAVTRFLQKKYPELEPIAEGKGALVLGIEPLVVKCHGAASSTAIQQAFIHTKQLLRTSRVV
jgi:glycerol-3-phosphate acyltransferase PlsX